MSDNRSGAQKAGWIVWWIQNAGALLLVLLMAIGGIGSASMSVNGSRVDSNYGPAIAMVTLTAGIFLVVEIAVQVLCYFAIKRLIEPQNYLWPIILIVVGFLGNLLYLIPGIWGLIINSSNHEVTPNPKPVDPEE